MLGQVGMALNPQVVAMTRYDMLGPVGVAFVSSGCRYDTL